MNENSQTSSDRANELLERAGFGKQVELFWGSRIGGYLQSRAQVCYTDAIQELKTCDPQNWTKVQDLQNKIWIAERFEQWLSEAVQDGIKSLEILNGEEEDGDQ